MGLLWLALCSTAVLPWAHELAHLAGHGPVAPPSQLVWQGDVLASTADATALTTGQEDDHAAETCLVCLHLFGQHLSPTGSYAGARASSRQSAPPSPAWRAAHAPPSWLTPAPRAPPAVTA